MGLRINNYPFNIISYSPTQYDFSLPKKDFHIDFIYVEFIFIADRPTADGASIKPWDMLANSVDALKINYGGRPRLSVFMINIDMKIYYCDLIGQLARRF